MLGIGDLLPDIEVTSDEGKILKLSQFRGEFVILFFYPKDDTPGCTAEACDFRDAMSKITKLGAHVIGASVDSVESHYQFKEKYSLPFMLLSDTKKELSGLLGVLVGETTARSTFIINPKGRIAKEFHKMKVEGHVERVLEVLEELKGVR
jgi:thioredoxin-dependent peroxiredoxin